jgi:hypothetical protein
MRSRRRGALWALARFVLATLCAGSALWFAPGSGSADGDGLDWDPSSPAVLRFTSARWSLIYPDRDFEAGCISGYLAFEFSPTGYFVFNNRVRGSWRIDELGNLKLRSRDGTRFTLIVDGAGLKPVQEVGLLRRGQVYWLCDD